MDAVAGSQANPPAITDPGSSDDPAARFSGRSLTSEAATNTAQAAGQAIPTIVVTDLKGREVKAEFTPFRSIEDSTDQEYIDHVFAFDPQLAQSRYVVSEKLDGANVTVMIDHNSIRYFARTQEFNAERPFFYAPMALKKYKEDFRKVQSALNTLGCQSFTFRGEYFGKGINRRIDYGQGRYYAPFIIEKDGITQTHRQFQAFMQGMKFCQLNPVPLLVADASFDEARAFNPGEVSTRAFTPDNETTSNQGKKAMARYDFIEGIVIQPVDRLIKDSNSPFLLKKHATGYREVEKEPSARLGNQGRLDEECSSAANMVDEHIVGHSFDGLADYINRNRLINVISHLGDPTSPKQIGSYIMAVLQDAKADYCKHHADAELEDRIPTSVFKPAHEEVVRLLRERHPRLFRKQTKIQLPS